jgi:hypothetical protein
MLDKSQTESLELDLKLITRALRCQNNSLIEFCHNKLNCLKGSEYTKMIFAAALLEVAETDPDSFYWNVENLTELECYTQLLDELVLALVRQLMEKNYILGYDFSMSGTRKIMLKKRAKLMLMRKATDLERILLKKVLLVSE